MIKPGDILLVDTNAIIEALRADRWHGMAGAFEVHTVAMCIQELGTGVKARQVHVDLVRATATVHTVSSVVRAKFRGAYSKADLLDPGEHDLLAHALERGDAWFLCGPDLAAMRAMHSLKLLDRAVSLEQVIRVAGIKPSCGLKANYTEKWLKDTRTTMILDDSL